MEEQTLPAIEEQPGAQQSATEQPSPAQLYQRALDELGQVTLALSEQRTVLAERERAQRALDAEIEQRRVQIEQNEVAFERLTGAVQVLGQLVQGGG